VVTEEIMKFLKDNLVYIVGVLVILLVCFATCGAKNYAPYEKPYKAVKMDSCEKMVGIYDLYLKAQAANAIAITKDKNPKILSIDTAIKLIECISETKIKVDTTTIAKIQVVSEDGKLQVLCGKAHALVVLEQQKTGIEATSWKGDEQMTMIPCE
jgi:hypothetical protein